MDCPKSRTEMLQYDFVEAVKNGMVFSPKYESRMKFLPPYHVVVFMNEFLDTTKLSKDMYNIVVVGKDLASHHPNRNQYPNVTGEGTNAVDRGETVERITRPDLVRDWVTFEQYKETEAYKRLLDQDTTRS